MSKRYLIYGIFLLIILGASIVRIGCADGKDGTKNVDVVLDEIGGDFSLKDQDGAAFSLKDHRDKVVLLFFGYLSCPDICPNMLSKLTQVYSALSSEKEKILTVFVSVDPERDTPENLKAYLEYFDVNSVGLTGSKDDIDAVIRAYKGSYEKVYSESAMSYFFNHTDFLYVLDPSGKVRYLFHPDDKKEKIIKAIRKILATYTPRREITSETGKFIYVNKCLICHGPRGAGDGPTASSINPRPTNFVKGPFKFTSGPPGSFPTDMDLFKSITDGSVGTAMPSWDVLSEEERWAVIEYIKSFAPEKWKKEPNLNSAS